MNRINKSVSEYKERPIKILQFGEGNFLRAFVEWMIQRGNDAGVLNTGVVVVQPQPMGRVKDLEEQDGLYTLLLEGYLNGEVVSETEVINVFQEFVNPYTSYETFLNLAENPDLELIISNTTEAGIAFVESDLDFASCPDSFPGKVLAFLERRFNFFKGDMSKGLEFLPCELIDNNGDALREILIRLCELKGYSHEFIYWLKNANSFANSLVDRIVPGYPKADAEKLEARFGYKDHSIVKGEIFHLFVIKGSERLKKIFPVDTIGLNVLFVDDIKPYKERKVRILNGAHTAMVPVAYLAGIDTVKEAVDDQEINDFILSLLEEEVIPTIHLPEEEKLKFANDVIERFKNPFIRHELLSISLNSMTKFVTRLLPSMIDSYNMTGKIPKRITFSLAALIVFYKGFRNGEVIPLKDDQFFLDYWKEEWEAFENNKKNVDQIVSDFLEMEQHFGYNLKTMKGVEILVSEMVKSIIKQGIRMTLNSI